MWKLWAVFLVIASVIGSHHFVLGSSEEEYNLLSNTTSEASDNVAERNSSVGTVEGDDDQVEDQDSEVEALTALLSAAELGNVRIEYDEHFDGDNSDAPQEGNHSVNCSTGESDSDSDVPELENPNDENIGNGVDDGDPEVIAEIIPSVSDPNAVMNAVADSAGNSTVILVALRRLWAIKDVHAFTMVLSCYPHSLPLDKDLGFLLSDILWQSRGGRDRHSIAFCESLLAARASAVMAEIAIKSCVATPTMPMMRVLRKYFAKTASASLIAEWSNYMDEVKGVQFNVQRGFLLDWLDSAISLEHRPLDVDDDMPAGMVGVIGRVSGGGMCYLCTKMPGSTLLDDRTDITVTGGVLQYSYLGSVHCESVNTQHRLVYTPPHGLYEKTGIVVVVTPSGQDIGHAVFIHKVSTLFDKRQIDVLPTGSIVLFAEESVLEVLSVNDITGFLMFADRASFQNDLYTLLMAVAERRRGRSVVLAGFIN